MSNEIGVPPLSRAEKLPRIGLTRDSAGALLTIAFDDPLSRGYSGSAGNRTALTGCQERIATDHGVPLKYEVRTSRYTDQGTRPLEPSLDLHTLGSTYRAKIADVETSPDMNGRQRKGLRKIERVGGMFLGIFADYPVRGSTETTVREPTHLYKRREVDTEILEESTITDHIHTRRGIQVGLGLPRMLDRRRSILGDRGLSNRGWAIVLSALAGGVLATPWVELPEGAAERVEHAAEDITGGHLDIGEIEADIPNIRIPIPTIGVDLTPESVTVDRDTRQIKDQGAPTITHTTEVIPGDTPEATVKLTQFGLGDFEGYVGQYDLTELQKVLEGLNIEEISVINISASASDESQKDIASGTCGIGVANLENEQLAQQRADEIISYLIANGVPPENIQTLDIGEKIISEKLTELNTLVSASTLTIQQACEYYNTSQQDKLPDGIRSFFDAELASNRSAVVDFYIGEERAATVVEDSSSCTIETNATEFVDDHIVSIGSPFSFDWNGNGLDLKGNSFGLPTLLVTAWGVLVFGQVSRRQRTVSRIDSEYQDVVLLPDGSYQPHVPKDVTPLRPPPARLPREVLLPRGCAVPPWRFTVPLVVLFGLALAASQCGPNEETALRYGASTELSKAPDDLVPCEEIIVTTRRGSGVHDGEMYGTETTRKTVMVSSDAIKHVDQ